MRFLREVTEGTDAPITPEGGWNVGHLANLGILLSCDGFSARFDLHNLNLIFDAAEANEFTQVRDHEGQMIDVTPTDDGIILEPHDNLEFPNGLMLDPETLKEMGIEQYEEDTPDDPASEFDPLAADDTVDQFDPLSEGIKRAYRRVGKKIKRGYRVTSGFRKGRVVASAAAAFKPRIKASTRSKLRIAAKRKRVIRILKGKLTRRKPTSQRLARLNKLK